jgi:hypothetical protein
MFDTLTKKRRTIDIDINSSLGDIDDLLLDLSKSYFETQKSIDEQIHNQRIANLESEMSALEDKAELEDEISQRLKYQLDIAKAQEKLANAQNEKNVKIFKDGKFQWIADPRAVEDAQNELSQLTEDYAKWEKDIKLKYAKEAIQAQIDMENAAFEQHYNDMENLASTYLDTLKTLYGNNIDAIIDILIKKVSDAQSTLDGLTPSNISTVSPSYGINGVSQSGTDKPVVSVKAGSVDEQILKEQYGDSITFANDSNGYVGVGTNRYDTNALYQLELLKLGLKAKDIGDLWSYDTGGKIQETGLAMVHKDEFMLNQDMIKNVADFVKNPMKFFNFRVPEFNNFTPAMATAGNSPINHNYYISVGEVRTNDASGFITNLKNMALKK